MSPVKKSNNSILIFFLIIILFITLFVIVFWQVNKEMEEEEPRSFLLEEEIEEFILDTREEEREESPTVLELDYSQKLPSSDISFFEAVSELNNSSLLTRFINEYFIITTEKRYRAKSPEEFFKEKEGNIFDLAVFTAYILKQNNIYSGIIRYNYQDSASVATTVFREGDIPKYFVYEGGELKIYHHGWSFLELIRTEEERLNIEIDEYAYFLVGDTDLSQPKEPYKWEEVE
jgi:cbb3-type cytochrome oxidase subunit 3